MASANLDLVRSIYADWERGNWRSVEWAHPQIDYVISDGPSPGRWTGPAGMALGWRGFLSAWEDFRSEAEEYRELDKERVLVLAHVSGQGKASGMKLGQAWTRHAALFQIQSDKVTKLFVYFDRERALADLGLSE